MTRRDFVSALGGFLGTLAVYGAVNAAWELFEGEGDEEPPH